MKRLSLVIIYMWHTVQAFAVRSFRISKLSMSVTTIENNYGLTPKLHSIVEDLRSITDDKLRYQQLLYFSSKLAPMDNAFKVEENKVPGCLSTVHVHATAQPDGRVSYLGDSDGLLTKGLVALLVTGLSGSTAEEIEKVKPEFIQYAKISASLTPGRNSGFLNMLNVMKNKARAYSTVDKATLSAPPSASAELSSTSSSFSHPGSANKNGPIYTFMLKQLSLLKPDELEIVNESHKHAGHAGTRESKGGESHFSVRIVAACFEGLSLVQRHKIVYKILEKEIKPDSIHALSIIAKTPTEVNNA